MSDLVRKTATRPSGEGAGTRIVFVRPAARSVDAHDAANPLPLRLAIGVIAAFGVIAGAWLIGTMGSALGFAALLHLPGMEFSFTDGLVAAALIAMSVPATIIRMGIEHPLLMMVGYGLIALPAAGLAGVRTVTPGGPKPHVLTTAFAYIAAVLGGVQACTIIWWVACPFRADLIAPLPLVATEVHGWLRSMQAAAGLDLLGFIVAGLWVVLVLRLPIARWLRAICASAAIAALVIVTVAMASTNATVAHATSPRTVMAPITAGGGDAQPRLILGRANGHTAMLSRRGESAIIELDPTGDDVPHRVVGQNSMIDFLTGHDEAGTSGN